jgi:hypothetical protein
VKSRVDQHVVTGDGRHTWTGLIPLPGSSLLADRNADGCAESRGMDASDVDVNVLLDELEGREFENEDDAFASIAVVAAAINETWESLAAIERQRRLREWLRRLHAVTRRAAEQFGALSFSITVSFPLGVSVSVTWDVSANSQSRAVGAAEPARSLA